MNTYTWEFPMLYVYPTYQTVQNAVHRVDWSLFADDGSYGGTITGTQELGPIDVQNFTPFANLTRAQVQGWVEALMGEAHVAALKVILDAKLSAQANPTEAILHKPWA
jgi:hypothetical protein